MIINTPYLNQLLKQLKELNRNLNQLLNENNKKAELEKNIADYKLEQKYFEEYYKEQNIENIEKLSFYKKTDDRILEFILDTQMLSEGKIKSSYYLNMELRI